MSTIRFVLRTDKLIKKTAQGKQLYPIQLIYQVKGDRKYFNTGQYVEKECWSEEEKRAIKPAKNKNEQTLKKLSPKEDNTTTSVNNALNEIRVKIEKIENKFKALDVVYDAEMVITELKGQKKINEKKVTPKNAVYELIDSYIEYNKPEQAKTSLAVYRQLKVHLQEFEKAKGEKISFESIDGNFLDRFNKFLISERKRFIPSKKKGGKGKTKTIRLNNTSAAKQISTLKTFLGYVRKQGIAINERYREFKVKGYEKEVVALTQSEFEAIYNLDLSNNRRLDEARDIFIFSCATGLRYSDLAQLDRSHIKGHYIVLHVKKTKEPLKIPLNPYSYAILKKYKDRFKPLPVKADQKLISNQKLNEAIRGEDIKDEDGNIIKHTPGFVELAGIVYLDETVKYYGAEEKKEKVERYRKITAHIGRKTFITLSLEKGMKEVVLKPISGHKTHQSFQRYVKVTDQHKLEAMKSAWGDIESEM